MTDQDAVRVALYIAIDTERALIDAYDLMRPGGEYSVTPTEPGVMRARANIAAFKRVLRSRYGHKVDDLSLDLAQVPA